MKHSYMSFVVIAVLSTGCYSSQRVQQVPLQRQPVVVEKVDREDVKQIIQDNKMLSYSPTALENSKVFGATGEGIAPLNTISPAQALALAKRAAIVDAYRQLGGKLYGVKVNAKDTVRDAMLKNSNIEAQVNALVKNATITDTSFKDGLFRVTMEMKIDERRWQEIFAY